MGARSSTSIRRLIERYAEMSATGVLVFYSLFVMSANPKLIATIPLVIFGLFRYGTWWSGWAQ